jgi:hypothetical protein
MFRVDHVSGSTTLDPPTPAVHPNGLFFSGGNPDINNYQLATKVEDEWLNMIQEELCNIVLIAGETLNKADRGQLARCIYALGHGGGGGGIAGDNIFEPPANGRPYSRGRLTGNDVGFWSLAITEPPADDYGYARVRRSGQAVGEWVAAAERRRLDAPATFYVDRSGTDAGLGTAASPWNDIQQAVDILTETLDANGFDVTLRVGISGVNPWTGFAVRQPLLGARRFGFKIVGSSSTAAREASVLGPSNYGPYDIYVNGGRVEVSGFAYLDAGPNGANVCCDGNASMLKLNGNNYFNLPHTSGSPLIWANDGGLLFLDDITTITGSPNLQPVVYYVQNFGLLRASRCGQIIWEQARSNPNFPAARLITEFNVSTGAIPPTFGRYIYAETGGIVDLGEEGTWTDQNGLTGTMGNSSGGFTVDSTGVLSCGSRLVLSDQARQGALPIAIYGGAGVYRTYGGVYVTYNPGAPK